MILATASRWTPGNAYIVGQTLSSNFPTNNALHAALNGTSDAFLAKILLNSSSAGAEHYFGLNRNQCRAGPAYLQRIQRCNTHPTCCLLQLVCPASLRPLLH